MRRLILLSIAGSLIYVAYTQQRDWAAEKLERSLAAEKKSDLNSPYRGVTASGTVEPGLFRIQSTGVSTAPVRKAAESFLKVLSAEQRKKTQFPVDDIEWRKWMNQDFYVRQGMGFAEMTEAQREAAFGIFKAALSAKGLQLSRDIMKLNETLGEMTSNLPRYGEWAYWITIMGEPSATKPWGFQMDGHHLIINYFVLGDQVVMTPMFVGSEPVIAPMGKYKGLTILQGEQAAGLEMLLSLDGEQRKKAVLDTNKPGNNNKGEAFQDNAVVPYEGLAVGAMTAAQKTQMVKLIGMFIDNMDAGHAKVKMKEVEQYLDKTYFAWIGGSEKDSVYYYRIHSPVVMIEFDHQRPAGLAQFSKNPRLPDHDHIHIVVRTPNGNDYGKDLLRQHLAAQKH
ncbi:MAG: DUF3500 domain-containing protein [Acidobacteria bacterium]|nr:DUF3500 domain-containing protein [Acidobacteriota bacterium]